MGRLAPAFKYAGVAFRQWVGAELMLTNPIVKKLRFPLKLLVSVVLLYLLFSHVDVAGVVAVLSGAKLKFLFVGLCLFVAAQLLSSVRWGLLARSVGFNNSFGEFATFYWIGMFLNLFFPSIVGGDVGRTFYLVQSRNVSASSKLWWTGKAAVSVLADRAIGLIMLVWMTAVTLLVYPVSTLPESVRYITFLLALILPFSGCLLTFLSRFFRHWFHSFGESVADALDTYKFQGRLALLVLILAAAIHTLTSSMYLPIGWSLGVDLPPGYTFVTYAVVVLLSTLPITFYGIGVRESALVFMLGQIDVPPEKALAIGLLWFVTVISLSLAGGVAFLMRKSFTGSPGSNPG